MSDESIGKAAELLQKIAKPALNIIFAVIPIIISLSSAAYKFYKKLPILVVKLIIGFIMCFFGGMFPTVFAAIQVRILFCTCQYCTAFCLHVSRRTSFDQAAEHAGLVTVRKALTALSEEVLVIIEENKKDNETDADGDGTSDVDQISNQEFVRRKVDLVLRKINPQKVNDAIASLYKV